MNKSTITIIALFLCGSFLLAYTKPTSALEFFHDAEGKEVAQIASVAELAGDYKISAVAPVSIGDNDKYVLTGTPIFTIEDLKGGRFTVVRKDGTIAFTSPGIRLAPLLWERFIATGADIESLRKTQVQEDQ